MKPIIALISICTLPAYSQYLIGHSQVYSPNPQDVNYNPFHPFADMDEDGIINIDDDDDNGDGILDVVAIPNNPHLRYQRMCETGHIQGFPNYYNSCEIWGYELNGSWYYIPESIENLTDIDGDFQGNSADTDDDGDGVSDSNDPDNPRYAYKQLGSDADEDGIINDLDPDDDNDGCLDIEDPFPFDPSRSDDCCMIRFDGTEDDWDADGCLNDIDLDPCDPTITSPECQGGPTNPNDPPGPGDPPEVPTEDNETPTNENPPIEEPEDPEPPEEPETPNENPYPEPPPTSDECCVAITTRLDVVNMWLDYAVSKLDVTNQQLYETRLDLNSYAFDLMYDEASFLNLLVNNAEQIEAYLEEIYELEYDQRFYLKKLYEQFYSQDTDPTDPTLPTEPTDFNYQPFQASTASTLVASHQTSQTEFGHTFQLPDIEPYLDQETVSAPVWDFDFTLPLTNHPFEFSVDFDPITPIRNIVHPVLVLLAALHSVSMLLNIIRK